MSTVDRWLLPDGVEEVLPPQAETLETARRLVLDAFRAWGYELVIPPMIEFLESLLTGTGTDLDLKTFKVTDQVSGRLMGIRADITPQVARIDAHSLKLAGVGRLCYAGTVLHAKADNMLASRTPISLGAELFGDTGCEGDLEIVSLMIESITGACGAPLHVELGDVGIFRALAAEADLRLADEERLFDLIQSKALPDLAEVLPGLSLEKEIATQITALPTLCGSADVLHRGRELFRSSPQIMNRLKNLEIVAEGVQQRFPDTVINYDLSELRGYAYHTGIVFAAFLKQNGVRLAKGGRYDDVGEVFGRARGATGFDIDLKALVRDTGESVHSSKIAAPRQEGVDERRRWSKIRALREAGYIVVEGEYAGADQRLEFIDGDWVLSPLN